jgi:cell shape-determining protein MreD
MTHFKPKRAVALLGFLLGYVASMAVAGILQTGIKMLLAALIGALLATGIATLRSNNSFKPKPLRGSA